MIGTNRKTLLVLILGVRGLISIVALVFSAAYFFWDPYFIKFLHGGESAVTENDWYSGIKVVLAFFLIFCIFILPFAVKMSFIGKLNFVTCLLLGVLGGLVVPTGFSLFYIVNATSGITGGFTDIGMLSVLGVVIGVLAGFLFWVTGLFFLPTGSHDALPRSETFPRDDG
jgi:hypothetical protein